MDDLTTWLRAQLDEDERVAHAAWPGPWRAAGPHKHGTWSVEGAPSELRISPLAARSDATPAVVWTGDDRTGGTDEPDAEHIARHDPARVLAEVDAKRRRLERHQPNEHFLHGTVCAWCSVPQAGAYQSWPCPDVRDDAAAYADRPGYRDEWKP